MKINGISVKKSGGKLSRRIKALLEQYSRIKAEHPEYLLLFEDGRYYHAFYGDAETLVKASGYPLFYRLIDGDRVTTSMVEMDALPPIVTELARRGIKAAILAPESHPIAGSTRVTKRILVDERKQAGEENA